MIKPGAQINSRENRKTIDKINKPKFFIWKDWQNWLPLPRLSKNKREKMQITKIRNEKRNITTSLTEIERTIKTQSAEWTGNLEMGGENEELLFK